MKTLNQKYWMLFVLFLGFSGTIIRAQVPDFAFTTNAKTVHSKTGFVDIHTSAKCRYCKVTIETALKKVKGVKKATLFLPSQKVLVTYNIKKTDASVIRKAISMAGYDADDIPADQVAHDNLSEYCRKGRHQ
jgi:periplasmic mercuric ion binding protein